jgi:hypothetical protein
LSIDKRGFRRTQVVGDMLLQQACFRLERKEKEEGKKERKKR